MFSSAPTRNPKPTLLFFAFFVTFVVHPLPAAEPNPTAAYKRASEPRSPQDSLKSIHLPPDLTIELVASEPLISSPVAIDWGPDGKLWVVEFADYPYGMDGKGKPGGRIKYLESTKNDGHYDKATLFLDNIKMPNGIIAWRKGVIVTAAPEVFYAEDTDGDGKADKRELLFKGFNPGNPQLRINALRWGLDNWLYLANGLSNGAVESIKTGQKLDIKNHDLRIRPDTGEMELVSGPSQFGREHDDWGNWFGTENAHPLFHFALEDRYLKRNPSVTFPDVKNQLLPLPLPPVFPRSPFAKRYIGLDHHGHFTSACGISIYRDDLLFSSSTNNQQLTTNNSLHAFICEPVHNLIQHQFLTPDGTTFTAQRVDGEPNTDFIAAEDNWFRPVMTRSGPDGAIWVVDMYRYMIEHPDWLNETGKKELAPFYREGDDKGRIYRVYPKNNKPREIPRLAEANTAQLVFALESPNGFTRDQAQRMLLWKNDPAAIPLLEKTAATSPNPIARLHALCTLAGDSTNSNLKPQTLIAALSDSEPGVRAHAIRLAEPMLDHTPDLLDAVCSLSKDHRPIVALQLAYTLGQSDLPQAVKAYQSMIGFTADFRVFYALISSATGPRLNYLVDLFDRGIPRDSLLYNHVQQIVLASGDRDALAKLLPKLTPSEIAAPEAADLATFASLLDRLAAHHTTLEKLTQENAKLAAKLQRFAKLFPVARRIAADSAQPPDLRLAAVNLLCRQLQTTDEDLKVVAKLFAAQTPSDLQIAAIRAAARTNDPSIPTILLESWPSDSPAVRSAIADALISRDSWALLLAQSPAAKDLDFSRRQRLLNHASKEVKQAAKSTLDQAAVNADRQKAIDSYQSALTLKGDIARGQTLFNEQCATCHRIGTSTIGHDIGPNLLTVRDWPKENLLTAILDPDRTVDPRYIAYNITLADNTTLTGLLTTESAGNITVKTLDDQSHSIPRATLKSLTSTNRSLMPQGFEAALTPQSIADLIAFIESPTPGR